MRSSADSKRCKKYGQAQEFIQWGNNLR
jgi:hypothetical protein